MNPKAKKTEFLSRATKGTLLGGALVVTGFAAAADFSGASAQVAKSVDAGFAPLADARGLDAQRLVIRGTETNRAIGAQELVIHGQSAWVIGEDAQERPAPDGFYRLSNNQIIKVAGGKAFQQSILAMAPKGWKDWLRKVSSRAPAADSDVQSVYLSLFS